MSILRPILFLISAVGLYLTAEYGVCAQNANGDAYIRQCVDSALVGVINNDVDRIEKWVNAVCKASSDSDVVCISKCLKACADVANNCNADISIVSQAIPEFSYRKAPIALRGLSIAYCAMGYFEYQVAANPSDIYFKRAERIARDLSDQRLELIYLTFRTQMYLRAQKYIEASYCARTLLGRCRDGNRCQELEFWGHLFMLRIYSAVHIEAAVALCVDDIEANGLTIKSPALAMAYSKALAIDRLRMQNFSEANVFAWQALDKAEQFNIAKTELWQLVLLRSLTLCGVGRTAESLSLSDSCLAHIDVASRRAIAPFSSIGSLNLLLGQIAQSVGDPEKAKDYLAKVSMWPQMLESDDITFRYYYLVEENALSYGDYETALNALETSRRIHRNAQLANARTLCKDMEVSTREDSLLLSRQLYVTNDAKNINSRNGNVFVFVLVAVLLSFAIVVYTLLRARSKSKKAQLAELVFNKHLAEEVALNTSLIEDQNKLISKRNFDLAASRSYAKRMQCGILPNPENLVSLGVKNSFVLRGTSEAISCCLYWYRRVGDSIVVCCADTELGDSVSGAMLSVVGLTIFNDAASKLEEGGKASELLRNVDANFIKSLPDVRWRSGISMSIAVADVVEKTVSVACASSCGIFYGNKKLTSVVDTDCKVGELSAGSHNAKELIFNYKPGDEVFLCPYSFLKVKDRDGEELGIERLRSIIERTVKLPAVLHQDAVLNEILILRNGRPFNEDTLILGFTLD